MGRLSNDKDAALNTWQAPHSSLGLREQNKREKVQRIRAAARKLFAKRGYDAATLREIARQAHVGLGTLFNYARDKRDLVFLVFNDELEAITDEALAAPRPDQTLVDKLIALFRPHYTNFSRNAALSRILLRELVFYSEGKQAARFQKIRRRLLSGIERIVREAQEDDLILCQEDSALIARHIFFTYSAEIRWWIAQPRPKPRAGLADLRRLLTLQVQGLQPGQPVVKLGTKAGSGPRQTGHEEAKPRGQEGRRTLRAGSGRLSVFATQPGRNRPGRKMLHR
jgi:AcrR family transcriptional regulator